MKKVIVLVLLVCTWNVFGKDTFTCMTNDVGQVVLTGYSGDSRVVIVPAGVNVIGRDVFCNRLGIAVIYLPDSVSRIDERAFYGVASLCHFYWVLNVEPASISLKVPWSILRRTRRCPSKNTTHPEIET